MRAVPPVSSSSSIKTRFGSGWSSGGLEALAAVFPVFFHRLLVEVQEELRVVVVCTRSAQEPVDCDGKLASQLARWVVFALLAAKMAPAAVDERAEEFDEEALGKVAPKSVTAPVFYVTLVLPWALPSRFS